MNRRSKSRSPAKKINGVVVFRTPHGGQFDPEPSPPPPSPPPNSPAMSALERTFIAIKPDGVHRGLVGKIIARFEERGYKLVALKQMTASKDHLEVHYQDLKDKPFFSSLISHMASGPVVVMVWQGLDAVKQGRAMLGATNPLQSHRGTIRGDFCVQTGRNICHGSDSVDSANREIAHWFAADEINDYNSPFMNSWVNE